MDFIAESLTVWNEGWGPTIATLLAVIALLKSTGKEIKQVGSTVWNWNGWAIVSGLYRKANTLYRVRRAKSVMRRTMEGQRVQIDMRVYETCLREDPGKATRSRLGNVTPAKPSWLNDYYVATALESLSSEGRLVKAKRYHANSWPPRPETYYFVTVSTDGATSEEADTIETNDQCAAYQSFGRCPRPSRFDWRQTAETISPTETRFHTTYSLKETAPPCEVCWEKEHRERDIRNLVDNITRYDLADVATPEIIGTNGELQETIAEVCIESPYGAEVNLIKPLIKQAIDIRQRQIACCTSRLQDEWRQGEKDRLVAALKEYIKSQSLQ